MIASLNGPASLRIQTVIYHNEPGQLLRQVESLGASAAAAREQGLLGHVEVRFGDCSEPPAEGLGGLAAAAAAAGLDDFRLDRFGENLGSAGGNNRLATGAETDFLLLINPDTYAAPSMIAELLRAHDDGVAAVEARQTPAEHPKFYDPESWRTTWVSSSALLVHTASFHEVGGLDPEFFFLHVDDVDLSWRLRLAGHQLITAPGAVAFHDKRFDGEGRVVAPDAERYHDIHGRMMLTERYRLADLSERIIRFVEANGDDVQRRALADFRDRKAAGLVPAPVDDPDGVARVDGPYFTPMRF